VVFIDGNPAKQHYRHYKIKNPTVTAGHSDDFAGLAEVIRRRFRKYAETTSERQTCNCSEWKSDWPDLVMIDGGKGQLSCCRGLARDEFNRRPAVVSRQAARRDFPAR